MTLAAEAIARFAADLDALLPANDRLGVAVSGGPDSLALLLLANAARPGQVEAATVDHRFRDSSRAEAEEVATICAGLGVPHAILTADWAIPPSANVQAEARSMRYRLLAQWAGDRGLAAVVTGHHADDQAETLLMRLARGAGVRGLGGVRPRRALTESVALVRPLLGWRRAELAAMVRDAGIDAVDDPTNRDPRHDRSRFRRILADAGWADPARLAVSAAALRDADEAIDWALAPLIDTRLVWDDGNGVTIDASGLPMELRRRLLLSAFAMLAAPAPRGTDLVRAMAALDAAETVTLSGLKLQGGNRWRLTPAPPRSR